VIAVRKRPSLWLLSLVPSALAFVSCALSADSDFGGGIADGGPVVPSPGFGDAGDAGADAAPAPLGLVATQVVTGDRHSCAVNAAGVVYCWGDNDHGQLGLPLDTAAVSVPRRVELPEGVRAVRLAAGASHTCALTDRKNLVCWGKNDRGQLGRPASATAPPDPVVLPSALTTAAFVALGTGRGHTCALYVQPQVGDAGEADAASADEVLRMACWGDNTQAQLARDDGPFAELPADVRRGAGGTSGPSVVARLAALAGDVSIASLRVGDVYRVQAWGDTSRGVVTTDPDAGPRVAPLSVQRADGGTIEDAVQLQAGLGHACVAVRVPADAEPDAGDDPDAAVGPEGPDADLADADPADATTADGGAPTVLKLLCWGGNESGQLARDTVSDRELADPTLGDPAFEGELVVGGRVTCLLDGATLRCAGANEHGQLGRGVADTAPHPTFAPVLGLEGSVRSAALGAQHGCAVVEVAAGRQQVACWGDNEMGQLGDGISLGGGYADAAPAESYRRARAGFVVPVD